MKFNNMSWMKSKKEQTCSSCSSVLMVRKINGEWKGRCNENLCTYYDMKMSLD